MSRKKEIPRCGQGGPPQGTDRYGRYAFRLLLRSIWWAMRKPAAKHSTHTSTWTGPEKEVGKMVSAEEITNPSRMRLTRA